MKSSFALSLFASVLAALGMLFPLERSQGADTPAADAPAKKAESAAVEGNAARDVADVVERVEPSVVRFDVTLREGKAIGSGFVVSADGLAVTNHHVIAGAKSAKATFSDATVFDVEGVLAFDAGRDVAIVKIKADRKLPVLPLAKQLPRKGEEVLAFGSPAGLSFTATEGIVSAIRSAVEMKQLGHDGTGTWLQSSAPISPGSSGGPLVNLKGEVVGANTSGLMIGQNLNFAISSPEIGEVIEISKGKKLADLSTVKPIMRPGSEGRPKPKPGRPEAGPEPPVDPIVVKLPAKRKFKHNLKIREQRDEFDGVTYVETDWWAVPMNDRRISSVEIRFAYARSATKPSLAVSWQLRAVAPNFVFLGTDARRAQLAGDEGSITLGRASHKGDILGAGRCSEILSADVPIDAFISVIQSRSARGRFGFVEFAFGAAHLECLREMASNMTIGTALDGRVVIERYPEGEDPNAPGFGKPKVAAGEKPAKPEADAESIARKATAKLNLAKQLLEKGRKETAKKYLEELIADYPDSDAGREAAELIKRL